jgi:phosphomannomutase
MSSIFILSESPVKFGTSGVRGLVEELTNEVCYAYATAFWRAVGEGDRVVIGHDLRPSSPQMTQACMAAMRDLGVHVDYVSALPTPAIAYYASLQNVPSIVITGSHIPFDRNGIKFYRREGEISKADEEAMLAQVVELPSTLNVPDLPAADPVARNSFVARYTSFFAGALKGKKIAVYQHSSVARDIIVDIFEDLGADVVALGRTETFVPIDTEAVRPEDIKQAALWANEVGFDAIVSTDGDADRPLIGDENGQWLRGDVVGVLAGKFLGTNYVVTPVSSNTVLEHSHYFSECVRTKIGSPYVIAGMEHAPSDAIVLGYEANGGVLLGSDIVASEKRLKALPTRDSILPMLAVFGLTAQKGCKVSELIADLPERYTHSDRVQNFPTQDSQALIAAFVEGKKDAASLMAPQSGEAVNVDITDGYRVTFSNGDIVHLRPSGNAPELRCYAEASDAEHAKSLCEACLAAVVVA